MPSERIAAERTVSDPVALRALAHPIRLQLVELVGREGSITGAEAARQLGISQALASHHLRQLAKYGFVEPADAADHRARPWRVTSTSTRFAPEEGEGRQANDLLQRLILERAFGELESWQQRRDQLDERWSDLTDLSNGLIYLTLDDLAQLRAAFAALIEPLVENRRVGEHDSRPDDAEPVSFTFLTIPVPRTEHGG
jgi:DNA-binding transcriptional ArsR family regulator